MAAILKGSLNSTLTGALVLQIDKEGANIDRVKQEMSENGLLPEEWGGETPMVAVGTCSDAKTFMHACTLRPACRHCCSSSLAGRKQHLLQVSGMRHQCIQPSNPTTTSCACPVQISAKKGDGVDDLLETVLLMAEVEELLANPDRPARGTIVESHLDKKTGAVATMLVAAGTLRQGDVVQAGAAFGKVCLPHTLETQSG